MHLIFGVLIFTVVALFVYLTLISYAPFAETVNVIVALILAFVAEYIYMKYRPQPE
ncbi:hypothetical protein [Natribacillus halophilus]|uniref:Uncharacterized protein n=1 Tax=Natribacillus halophilus TaxID=549003 RepID=A0A1G8LGM4_9BACI|nr:hypothetical protein [Natribacillus halophilus]SDI54834.1 hypothetical protein SAMN04488123_10384 [Natribacillus halophilus]